MNAASPIGSPNNWKRGPGSTTSSSAGGGGNLSTMGSSQPTSPYGQPTYGGPGPGPGPGRAEGGGGGLLNERDAARNNNNYQEAQSPLSPSSDFSLSKYDQQLQPQQQRNLARYPSNDALPNSRSNPSLMSQRSSGADVHENIIIEHYIELQAYVTSNPPIDGNANARQSKAREKLHRLSPTQFFELSTDVFDERIRRKKPQVSDEPFLRPKTQFHAKRNQARQKLATLPPGRFKELASDVVYEIEKRYPQCIDIAQGRSQNEDVKRTISTSSFNSQLSRQSDYNNNPYGRSQNLTPSVSRDRFPSNSSSGNVVSPPPIPEEPPPYDNPRIVTQNTIIPNKSTMVEEDEPDLKRTLSTKSTIQKTIQPTSIIPNKSTMIEEDSGPEGSEDDEANSNRVQSTVAPTITSRASQSPPVFKSNAFINAGKLNGIRSISPPPVLPKSRAQIEEEDRKQREMQTKLDEYEDTIEALKERIAELQMELKKSNEMLTRERNKTPPPAPAPPPMDNRRLRELEEENQRLQDELKEQQQVTTDVRREATELLEEMKLLTSQQEQYFENQSLSTQEVTRLQAEIRDWKSRYAQLKVQLRSATASSTSSVSNLTARIDSKLRSIATDDGIIEDGTISRFQNSIDDLLSAARRDDNEVLEVMTEVVKATRGITDDLKRHGSRAMEDDPRIRKLTTRLSATANNLITATKNHAASQGVSPVSLVDAAASHLTSTVVDLVKMVKMRPGSGSTYDESQSEKSRYSDLHTPITSPGISSPYNVVKKAIPNPLNLGAITRSVSQRTVTEERYPPRSPDSPRSIDSRRSAAYVSREEEELRNYLDNKTQAIVDSIQSLLTRIRNPKLDMIDDFRPQVAEITTIVDQIVTHTIQQNAILDRLVDGPRMMEVLDALKTHAEDMNEVVSTSSVSSGDGFKKRLARISFDISKQIKELVRIVESDSSGNSRVDLT